MASIDQPSSLHPGINKAGWFFLLIFDCPSVAVVST